MTSRYEGFIHVQFTIFIRVFPAAQSKFSTLFVVWPRDNLIPKDDRRPSHGGAHNMKFEKMPARRISVDIWWCTQALNMSNRFLCIMLKMTTITNYQGAKLDVQFSTLSRRQFYLMSICSTLFADYCERRGLLPLLKWILFLLMNALSTFEVDECSPTVPVSVSLNCVNQVNSMGLCSLRLWTNSLATLNWISTE